MKFIYLLPALILSPLAQAESRKLGADALEVASLVRSSGARSCFETLEKNGGVLNFEEISVDREGESALYTIKGFTIVQGDILAGSWTLEIASQSRPEEGTITSCEITEQQD